MGPKFKIKMLVTRTKRIIDMPCDMELTYDEALYRISLYEARNPDAKYYVCTQDDEIVSMQEHILDGHIEVKRVEKLYEYIYQSLYEDVKRDNVYYIYDDNAKRWFTAKYDNNLGKYVAGKTLPPHITIVITKSALGVDMYDDCCVGNNIRTLKEVLLFYNDDAKIRIVSEKGIGWKNQELYPNEVLTPAKIRKDYPKLLDQEFTGKITWREVYGENYDPTNYIYIA